MNGENKNNQSEKVDPPVKKIFDAPTDGFNFISVGGSKLVLFLSGTWLLVGTAFDQVILDSEITTTFTGLVCLVAAITNRLPKIWGKND